MRLHFGDGFPISYRNEMKSTILANTTDAIAMVLEYMKDANITFSDILAHRLQEYLVNSRSENGWITKDFIIFDDKYTATTITTNNMDHHNLQRQESSFKANLNNVTDHLTSPYDYDHHSITTSSSLPIFKKFESIIGIKSMENWRDIIENKTLLHHLIHVLLQSGIDNWSSFLMYQSGPAPPPAPTTLPPLSVEDELLDYIVMSDSYDTSEDGDDDNDHERDDTESGLVNSSNSSLVRTLVKNRIIQDDYIPTLQDLLIMKQSSKAVRESLISIGSITLRTINLGEQSEHLNKQFHYFESVNMILFFISLEDVYRFTYIQGNKIIHHPSFKLFEDVIHSPDLTKKDIIVFLNKYDKLKVIITQYNNNNNEDHVDKIDRFKHQ
ncbi:putative gtp-binding protein alpha subunit [Schistosoma mansoni]|uniref:putative gtp-binding protein alpha subunit n=1 Tax=Schistosoma mansoni TaxID=6183 RepID=UPI0001A63A6C|nr:putative gtp-binding protein alpha subunit [Schistosoma mansoni]|eukprot:XP_018652500.1 putative gtp-binding protein alpha subunit [Schistosoma mansoni]